jgi:salicylate hydroxylase
MRVISSGRSMADVLIAGGGIGGLAAALALQRQGRGCELWEQAPAFGEVGAGIQMGPNVTRILQAWGLGEALMEVAAQPHELVSSDAVSGRELGRLSLHDMRSRYGAPYVCIHRADLHALLQRALDPASVRTHLGRQLVQLHVGGDAGVQVTDADERRMHARVLIGADGLWSQVRHRVWGDGAPASTGHWAYRTLLPMSLLPHRWREPRVQVWMAPGLHAVHYPVRRGEWLNVVVLVEGQTESSEPGWDVARAPEWIQADVQAALRGLCHDLHDVLRPVAQWRAWPLCARAPLQSADGMARGRVALLGDAAHPMLPYLAQGAGMAIEDAQALAAHLATGDDDEQALQRYAQSRWARNAQVQVRAQRNGRVFHASGAWAWARNTALRLAANRLMDQPWLYGADSP